MADFTPTALAEHLAISVPYASQILNGRRPMPRELAIRLFRKTGEKLGPIANAEDHQIDTLEAIPATAFLAPKAAA